MTANSAPKTSFFASRAAWITALLILLGLGFAIRLYDLTDLPLDFHPTRQLLSALKARGMYYQTLIDVPAEQREFAIQQWKVRASVEPEFFEHVVAFTYQFTGEGIWVARLYSSLFWVIGGVFLFLLARGLVSTDGALASLAVYLFLPYSIIASRSFQPDPLMVALTIIFWWAVYKWSSPLPNLGEGPGVRVNPSPPGRGAGVRSWLFPILAGLFGGFAIFIKFVAAFFVIGGGIGAVLGRESIRETLRRPQVYVMTALGVLPGAAYLVYGVWIAGYLGQQFSRRFIPSLFLSPSYYLGWIEMLNLVIGGALLMLALAGLFFFKEDKLRFMLGLWAGYAFFGLFFNYHISTHDYYSLPLIPIAALSLAPLADSLFAKLNELAAARFTRTLVLCVLLLGLFASVWNVRANMKSIDYRREALMWSEIGEKIGGSSVIGLTQDYGSRLAYWGWKSSASWPTSGDLFFHDDLNEAARDFEKRFEETALKKDLFVVTDFDELHRQAFLDFKLQNNYPIFAEGNGYVIYDLRYPLSH